MRIYLALALGGIPIGAMYALQALGIVIVYNTSRVFNFATGAIGLACAYVASELWANAGLPIGVAVLVAVVFGVLLGGAIELSLRPVRGDLARTIVTLGWLLALQGAVGATFGDQAAAHPPATIFSSNPLITTSLRSFSVDEVAVVLIVGVLVAGLFAFFRFTPLGTAMRAVAASPEVSSVLGLRVSAIRALAWGLGGGIAGLSGVLLTPLLNSLDTVTLVIFTVQALAAALVGRLSSLPWTLAGGIGLGVLQPVVAHVYDPPGINELTAFVVVGLAMFAFRRGSGRRDAQVGGLQPAPLRPMPTGRTAAWSAVGVGLAVVLLPLIMSGGGNLSRFNVTQTAVWGLAVLSLVMLVGVVGQVSACQAVFMAVGAFGTGIAEHHGAPFLLAMLCGALLAAAAAAVVGLPAARLAPLEMAIVTVSLAFTADRFLYSWPVLVSAQGSRVVSRPGFAPAASATGDRGDLVYAWLVVAILVAACVAVALLRRARTGAALTALRSSEPAATAMGFNVPVLKVKGFAVSGFLAGLGGALYAGLVLGASGASFSFTKSLSLLAFAVIVGAGSVPGAVIGGFIVTLSTISVGSTSQVASGRTAFVVTMVTGVLLIATLMSSPEGLSGLVRRVIDRARPAVLATPSPDAVSP